MKVQRVEDVECWSVLNRDRLLAALADVMLVRRLRLSWETTDVTSRLHAEIMGHATKLNRSLWSYVLSRFSGRALAQNIVNAGGRMQGGSVREILAWCWDLMDHPEEMLSTAFRPQSCQRGVLRRMSRATFLEPATLRDKFQLNLMPPRLRLKNDQNVWLRKREVMKQMRDQKGTGPFYARNQYRIMHSLRKGCPTHGTYAETGPGARRLLNVLHGLSPGFSLNAASQEACDSYNHLLLQAHKQFLAHFGRRVREAQDENEKHWLESVELELRDVDMFEFFLCEGSKILQYLVGGSPRYLRGHQEEDDASAGPTIPSEFAMGPWTGLAGMLLLVFLRLPRHSDRHVTVMRNLCGRHNVPCVCVIPWLRLPDTLVESQEHHENGTLLSVHPTAFRSFPAGEDTILAAACTMDQPWEQLCSMLSEPVPGSVRLAVEECGAAPSWSSLPDSTAEFLMAETIAAWSATCSETARCRWAWIAVAASCGSVQPVRSSRPPASGTFAPTTPLTHRLQQRQGRSGSCAACHVETTPWPQDCRNTVVTSFDGVVLNSSWSFGSRNHLDLEEDEVVGPWQVIDVSSEDDETQEDCALGRGRLVPRLPCGDDESEACTTAGHPVVQRYGDPRLQELAGDCMEQPTLLLVNAETGEPWHQWPGVTWNKGTDVPSAPGISWDGQKRRYMLQGCCTKTKQRLRYTFPASAHSPGFSGLEACLLSFQQALARQCALVGAGSLAPPNNQRRPECRGVYQSQSRHDQGYKSWTYQCVDGLGKRRYGQYYMSEAEAAAACRKVRETAADVNAALLARESKEKGESSCELREEIRRPWDVLRDEVVSATAGQAARGFTLRWSKQVFGLLGALTRFRYVQVSLNEAGCYLHYRRIQHEVGKPDEWDELSADAREDFHPPDLLSLLRSLPADWKLALRDFHLDLLLSGQPQEDTPGDLAGMPWMMLEALALIVHQAPHLLGAAAAQWTPQLPIVVKQAQKEVSEPGDLEALSEHTCRDIESELLRAYPSVGLVYGSLTHWGHLIHPMVACAKQVLQDFWPRELVIASSSSMDSQDLLSLQPAAKIIAVVVCSDTHWALLGVKVGSSTAVFFDGLRQEEARSTALAVLAHLNARLASPVSLEYGRCPPQEDGWSCGLRCLVALRCMLVSYKLQQWPPEIPENELTATALQSLCHAGHEHASVDAETQPVKPEDPAESVALTSVVRPATAAGSQLVSDADAADADHPRKKRKLSAEELETKNYKAGMAKAKDAGIYFNQGFQQEHVRLRCHMNAGHWRDWCVDLHLDKAMRCRACAALRDRVLLPAEAAGAPTKAPEPLADAPAYAGQGHPRKGCNAHLFATWMAENRGDVYEHVRGNWWFCLFCGKEVNMRRSTMSAMHFLREHESSKSHKPGGLPASSKGPSACQGVLIGAGASDLDRLDDALRLWVSHGMIQTTCSNPLDGSHSFQLSWKDDQLLLRSTLCKQKAPPGGDCCVPCAKLASGRSFSNEVTKWATRIHLIEHAKMLGSGSDLERLQSKEALLTSDVYMTKYGRAEIDTMLSYEDPLAAITFAKQKFSFPASSRTERLLAWMDLHISQLALNPSANLNECTVLRALTEKFSEAVLTGQALTSDRAMTSLLLSLMSKRDKLRRGKVSRPCSAKHMDLETLDELLCMLGSSGESKRLLSLFGVPESAAPKINYNLPSLPNFFVSHRDAESLSLAARAVVPLHKFTGGRAWFVSIDETYWHASLNLIAGLRGVDKAAIGAAWSEDPDEDRSYLKTPLEAVPDISRLSKLTLDFVVARTDSSKKTWHLDMVPVSAGASSKASSQLRLLDGILLSLTRANGGVPPIGVATDGAAVNQATLMALAGCLPAESCKGLEFFSACKHHHMQYLPFVRWGYISYQEHNLFGSVDCLHNLK
ncbi:unnamed protein product, partial [Symbiodinium sp. KB8]